MVAITLFWEVFETEEEVLYRMESSFFSFSRIHKANPLCLSDMKVKRHHRIRCCGIRMGLKDYLIQLFHCIDEETETKREKVTCLKSHRIGLASENQSITLCTQQLFSVYLGIHILSLKDLRDIINSGVPTNVL
jgi:hypothetical protein